MKSRILMLILCVCLTGSLCACGNKSDSGENIKNVEASQTDPNSVIELSQGCYNQYGYYCFSDSLIYYFDTESKQKIVLCNNPNCEHNSTECNAYISSKADTEDDGPSLSANQSAVFIFAKGDRIYLLLNDGTMLSIKYDGTDHKTVAEIDSKYSFEKAYMLGSEIVIYSFYSVQEHGEIIEKACFITYNTDTNKWEQGKEFDRNLTGDVFVGLTLDKMAVFYHDDETPEIPEGTPVKEAIKIQNNTKCQLYSIDIKTAEKKDIYDGTQGECSPVTMLNGKIYFHSRNKEQLCEMIPQTGEITVLYENYPGEIVFGTSLDNNLVIKRTKDATIDWNPENEVSEFFNVETKELSECYELQSNLDWNNGFRGILAETQDYYIMIYKADFVVDNNGADIPSVSGMTPYVGIISKTDFWNKNYNFEEISWF